MNTTPDLRSLPRPTTEQYRAFAEHVGEAHTWYKHLPLLTGGQLVVFLAPDAGIGRLGAQLDGAVYHLVTPPEGPVFTKEHPRIHYSWKTTEEYRRRFGYLDYACRTYVDGAFGRDVGEPMELPEEIGERCTFTLYPYVAGCESGYDSVRWAHQEAVERLPAGEPHPQREAVLEWARLAEALSYAWLRYRSIQSALKAVYYRRLRPPELEKIQRALKALRD